MAIKIRIKGTEKIETLELRDANGIDWVSDFIGNHGGFGSEEHQISLADEYGLHHATQEVFDWWEKAVEAQRDLDDRIAELEETHGKEAVWEAMRNARDEIELMDAIAAVHTALDEAFGK